MTFSGSLRLDFLKSKIVDKTLLSNFIKEISIINGINISKETMSYLIRNQNNKTLIELHEELVYLKTITKLKTDLRHLAKYSAATKLIELIVANDSLFDESALLPCDFEKIAENGAIGLYEYGKSQFKKLNEICLKIVDKIVIKNITSVCLIESPLGNVIPVQVLSSILESRKVKHKIFRISIPRNETVKKGNTIKQVISNCMPEIITDSQLILYVDDVISGTRFRKITTVFEKEARKYNASFLPVSLEFKPFKIVGITYKTDYSNNLKKVKTIAENYKNVLGFYPNFSMPVIKPIYLDSGNPFVLESPVVWGEQPFVAGMRKVNLIFNLIEEFESTHKSLIDVDSVDYKLLVDMWSYDTKGIKYEFEDGVLVKSFKIFIDLLSWSEIRRLAKKEFPKDYLGDIENYNSDELCKRINWLIKIIQNQISVKLTNEPNAPHYLTNALYNVFNAKQKYHKPGRDFDYCNCFIEYSKTIKKLRIKLVDLIIQSA